MARRCGKWRVSKPDPVQTVFTIGLEPEPEQMAAGAAAASDFSLLKIKLNNDRPVERIAAIRQARPDVRLVVDVNQGWTSSNCSICSGAACARS